MDKSNTGQLKKNPIALLISLTLGVPIPIVSAQEIEEEVETLRLETITVEAQKRRQSMQTVPVSVSAFSGKQLDQAVLKDIFDVASMVPASSAFQTQNVTNTSFSIRGIGTSSRAATEQLQIWGERNHIPVVAQGHGSDSASVIFDAMQSAKAKNIDVLIADTAGRLQNKTHLMAS